MKRVPIIQLICGKSSGLGVRRLGDPGDRGCVACGVVHQGDADRVRFMAAADGRPVPQAADVDLVLDARGRYWCLDCAVDVLANVRRRVDDRIGYDYPWRFEDTGGAHGQHARAANPSVLDELLVKLEAKPSIVPNIELSQEHVDALLEDGRSSHGARAPEFSYVRLPDGKATVTCTCGWSDPLGPVNPSPFDPMEALVAASVEHLRCEAKP